MGARLPATYAVAEFVFRELFRLWKHFSLPSDEFATCLDLGSGPGVATLAAQHVFPSLKMCRLVDQDQPMLSLGQNLLETLSLFAHTALQFQQLNLLASLQDLQGPSKKSDLVILSYVLGEIPSLHRLQLLETALEICNKALLIMLPGTPDGFQILLTLRDFLREKGAFIAAPCPHQKACPLNPAEDWCHFSVRLERQSWHRTLKEASLGFEDEKFCYLIAFPASWKAESTSPDPVEASLGQRVLRPPLKRCGHLMVDVCRDGTLQRLSFSKKQGPLYKEARSLKWGDWCS